MNDHGTHQPHQNAGPTRASQIHAPWREQWIERVAAEEDAKLRNNAEPTPPAADAVSRSTSDCFLRRYWLTPEDDLANHVIVRVGSETQRRGGMILLNAYPYAGGHLLVALGDGRPRLTDYDESQRRQLWSLVDLAAQLCEDVLQPQGVNIGLNIGRAAGAGVPEHAHVHVIPRWFGDVNFLSAVGNVRLINASQDRFYEKYRDAWRRMHPNPDERPANHDPEPA